MKKELAEPIEKLKLIAEEEKHINPANSSTRTRTRIRAHYAEDGVHNYYNAAADGDGVDLDLDTNFNEEVEQEQSEPQQEVSWRISTRIKQAQHDVIKHGTSTSTKWRIEIPRVETQTSEECYNSSSTTKTVTKTVRKRKCDQLTQLISKKNKHNPSRSKSQSRLDIENRLKDLIAFKAKYGHCKVNKSHIEKYKSLVHWCNYVRKSRRKIIKNQKPLIQLSDHDIKRLIDMGFEWSTERVPFKSRLEDLAAFKAEHGHCMAPKQGMGKYKSLGLWCYQMRSAKKIKEKNKKPRINLSDVDIQRLTDMGFEWEPQRKCFQERVEDLVAFKAEHGHCNVFEHWVQHEEDRKKYRSLRTWCYKVRTSGNHIRKNRKPKIKLSNDDVELLTGMGFAW